MPVQAITLCNHFFKDSLAFMVKDWARAAQSLKYTLF